MPDVTTDAPVSPASATGSATAVAPAGDDPFLRLHKMSTTAGVGSGDYVAINGTAVACLLLGLASALVLAGGWVFFLVPLTAVFCGVLGFVQVGRSNGTQTGRGIAALGLLLSLGLGGYAVATTAYTAAHLRADQNAIVDLTRSFGKNFADRRYDAAYARCDTQFQNAIPYAQFAGVLAQQHDAGVIGSVTGMDWNGLLTFTTDEVNGDALASGITFLRYSKVTEPFRIALAFRRVGDKWYVDQMPGMMVSQKPAAGKPAGPRPPGTGTGDSKVYGPMPQ